MVPVRNAMRIPIHSVMTPRLVPKTVRKEMPATGTGSTPTTPAVNADPAANFKSLFGHAVATPAAAEPPKPALPTLQSVFGGNPYVSNPGGMAPNGVTYGYNPTYFATRATADKLAQMYGGTVVEMNAITPYGPFQQNQMNQMIRFPNGNVVNAGVLASYFDRGWTQDRIDGAIAGEINQIPG
jgi:hypothetical protein